MESDIIPISKEEFQPISSCQRNNVNKKNQTLPINFTNSNFFSKFFYLWVKPAIELANKRPLNIEDLGNISKEQRTCKNLEKYKEILNKKVKSKRYKYPLFFSIFSLNIKYFLFIYFLFIIDFSFVYEKIYFFKKIISTFSSGDFFPDREFSFFDFSKFRLNIIESIILYILARMFGSYNYHYLLIHNEILNRKIINETSALLMDKLLKSNAINSSFSKGEGEKINLVEIDAEKIGYFFIWFPRICIYPFKISFSLYLLFNIYGKIYLFAIIGLILIVTIIISFQIVYNRNIKYVLYQKDQRMKIVTYVFTVLKNLKLDALEDEFINRIDKKRKDEIDITRKQFNLEIIIGVLNKNLNLILMILTLYIFVNSKEQLEISSLFASFQLINTITGPITVIPIFLSRIAGNLISIKRLQAFLLSEEHYELNKNKNNNNIAVKFTNTTFGIKMAKKMDKNEKISLDYKNVESNIINIFENLNLEIKKGEFVAIVGDSGVGKTCLLNAIMNNFSIISTDSNPEINGEISFFPSQPWLMTESIKNNIIFFTNFNRKNYNDIISLCHLKSDFEKLPEGDLTIVNSTCSNISEGQKIRISLARCLYRNADIYLLDDIFSSLDQSISEEIFDKVFCKFLKNKTRIIVMNKKKCLKFFDKIIALNNRKIIFEGNYDEFEQFKRNENKEEIIQDNNIDNNSNNINNKKNKNKNKNKINNDENNNNMNINKNENKEKEEDSAILSEYKNPNDDLNSISRNHVSYKTYLNYIKLQGGYTLFFTLIILIIIVKSLEIYRNTIIPKLAKSYKEISKEEKSKLNNDLFITNLKKNFFIFLKISLMTVFLDFIVRFVTTRITLNSMHTVHHKMIIKFIKAPINLFHDVVPVGQILNRLTRDVGVIESIIRVVNSFIRRIFSLVSCMILCYLYNKYIIYLSPIIIIYALLLTSYYIKTTRNLTRVQRISYAPIMTVFSETIRGLDIIRTCHAEKNTKEKFMEKIDERYGVHLFSAGLRRWHAIRRSTFINLTFGAIILYMAYYTEIFSVRAIAIILQYTEEFLNHLINTSVFYMDLETNMIGLERCEQIFNIETEKNSEDVSYINETKYENWPEKANIEFNNYFARYRPNTPDILKNINLKIKKGEKVCLMGRTGSGKSSLINALVRIIEPRKGKIYIDNDDIENINIKILRKKISILSQEILLIESNLKDNIDPLNIYTDKEILNIINDLCLFKNITDENKLNFEIKENGKNLSSGEKKLICFARTIIKKNKIVILDDPTSGLDMQTKNIIYKNVKKYLKDKTVIIITNQEELIKLCDKIVVVDNGNIVEYGSYNKLIKDKINSFCNLFINS